MHSCALRVADDPNVIADRYEAACLRIFSSCCSAVSRCILQQRLLCITEVPRLTKTVAHLTDCSEEPSY